MSVLTKRPCGHGLRRQFRWVLAVVTDAGTSPVVGLRACSTTVSKPKIINRNISVREAENSPIPAHQRPTVLIYNWMMAKAKHIYRYADFYHTKGFDVVNIKIEPSQLVWPKRAQVVAQQVIDLVTEAPHKDKPLLIHGFSVGGYMFSETLVKIINDPVLREEVGGRIKAQILDSPAAVTEIAHGFPQALTQNRMLQKALETILSGYMNSFSKSVSRHYHHASDTFHENPLRVPALFLYCKNDPIAAYRPIEEVISLWESRDIPVWYQCWEKSKHVSHLQYHPIDYINALNDFLSEMGLQRREEYEQQLEREKGFIQQQMRGY